jgi:hypothetical protein
VVLVFKGHLEFDLCRFFNLPEVATYWEQVIINDYQKIPFCQKYYQFFIQYRK